jgi:transcriptional regulator with XRE-family HTH domain
MIRSIFAQRIKELREQRGWTQEYLGSLINVSDVTINRYEKDNRKPDQEILNSLANIFDVSIDYLLGRTEIKRNPTRQEIAAFMAAKKITGRELGPSLLSQVEDEKTDIDFNSRIANLSNERQQTLERILRSLETEEKIEKEKLGTDVACIRGNEKK